MKKLTVISFVVALAILVFAPLNQVSADNNDPTPPTDANPVKANGHGAGGW
ncbi:hypothetical protein Q9R46_16780 [Paenibacillus sp. RRE4]|uniref:hypothetical protein n=1 Tax=Paenibacillus sp. RRE4 TaxID=2962587 RepID=UPI002881341F|nr:hypothetical protein [Paenibacillus sp. RRE4]MDT0124316.1 hypothetical protein [Paenibacillus sp. RRE4]